MNSSPGLRERKKQKTRWAIQEHALRLFAQQGYDATTVEQIAAAAEISPSTFFRYFKAKEDVVVEDQYDALIEELIMADPAEQSPVAMLRKAIRKGFGEISEAERVKVYERTRLIMSTPALRARSMENLFDSLHLMAAVLAKRLGRPENDFALRVVAGAVIGVLMTSLDTFISTEGHVDMADLMDRSMAQLEAGLPL